jgi:hypothetical protein
MRVTTSPGEVLLDRPGPDMAPVAQHGERVAEREQFLEPVGDVDQRDAAGEEAADEPEEFVGLSG